MAIGTYPELVTAINDWLLRNGDDIFAARVPNLIALNEATLDKTLRSPEMEEEVDLVTAAGVATVDLPSDYIETRSLTIPGVIGALDQYSPEALDEAFAEAPQGTPKVYSVWRRKIRLGPTPAAVQTLRLRYFQKVPRLSTDAPTNDVLTAHPDIYLYGSLLQAAPTLKDQGAVELWKSAYEQAIGLANEVAQRSLIASAKIRRRYGS